MIKLKFKLFFIFVFKAIFLAISSIASVFSFEFLFNQNFLFFIIWIIIDFSALLIFYLILIYKFFLINQVAELMMHEYQKMLISKMSKMSLKKIRKKNSGYYLSIFNNDLITVKNNIYKNYFNLIDNLFSFIALIFVLFYFSYILLIIVCLIIFFLKILTSFLEKWNKKILEKLNLANNIYLDKTLNLIQGFSKFVFQNKVGFFIKQILKKSKILSQEKIGYDFRSNIIKTIIDSLIDISQFVILVVVGLLFYQEFIKIGVFLVIVGVTTEFINLANDFNGSILELRSSKGIKTKIKNSFENNETKSSYKLTTIKNIEFKNVDFSFKQKIIFRNFNFKFQENKKYLIIAPNGKGKTTLAKLLLGLLDISSGKILVNNENLKNIDLPSLHKHIFYIDNYPFIFPTSLENNISVYDEKIDLTKYQFALENSLIDFKIKSNSSSGENQRINLGRLFYNPKKLIILDEALANIDIPRRKIIENNILKLNCTLINITHHNDSEMESKYDYVINL